MSKKKHYDKDGNEIRSRPEKSFYKKVSFWLIVVLSVTVGAVGMYILTTNDEVVDEILEIEDKSYRSFDRWEIDMTSPIINKTIDDNILTLELDSDENEM